MAKLSPADDGSDVLGYAAWLDKFAGHDRAPRWTISNSASSGHGRGVAKAPSPGDHTSLAQSGALAASRGAPTYTFGRDPRLDRYGAMKAVRSPNNRLHPDTGPGEYAVVDGMHVAKRVSRPSSTSWSMPTGLSQEEVRQRKLMGLAPGPGAYEALSRFDTASRRRERAMPRCGRAAARQWQPEFARIFQSCHASATQGLRRGAPGTASAPAVPSATP